MLHVACLHATVSELRYRNTQTSIEHAQTMTAPSPCLRRGGSWMHYGLVYTRALNREPVYLQTTRATVGGD